jgi:hypothetical protein
VSGSEWQSLLFLLIPLIDGQIELEPHPVRGFERVIPSHTTITPSSSTRVRHLAHHDVGNSAQRVAEGAQKLFRSNRWQRSVLMPSASSCVGPCVGLSAPALAPRE